MSARIHVIERAPSLPFSPHSTKPGDRWAFCLPLHFTSYLNSSIVWPMTRQWRDASFKPRSHHSMTRISKLMP